MKTLMILLSYALLGFTAHDYFISICTIKYVPEDSTLQITWRMTTHDIEHALEEELGGNAQFGSEMETDGADSLLQDYLLNHISLTLDGVERSVQYVGKEVEYEDMYCYLQVKDVPIIKELIIKNTLLFELNDEQSNAIHFETINGTSTKYCTREHRVVSFAE